MQCCRAYGAACVSLSPRSHTGDSSCWQHIWHIRATRTINALLAAAIIEPAESQQAHLRLRSASRSLSRSLSLGPLSLSLSLSLSRPRSLSLSLVLSWSLSLSLSLSRGRSLPCLQRGALQAVGRCCAVLQLSRALRTWRSRLAPLWRRPCHFDDGHAAFPRLCATWCKGHERHLIEGGLPRLCRQAGRPQPRRTC